MKWNLLAFAAGNAGPITPTPMFAFSYQIRLNACVLVEQELDAVIVFRRIADGFVREIHKGLDIGLSPPEVQIELPWRKSMTA